MVDTRVLVIGLDGATFDLIRPWKERLPALHRLLRRGVSGELGSTVIPISSAAWTSFATGRNPGKHGIFDFSHPGQAYDHILHSSRDRKCEAIWNILSRYGKKVCIINVPATYPPEEVNGFMVSGFPTPEETGDFTYPPSLLKELKSEVKNFRLQFTVPCAPGNEDAFFEEQCVLTDNVTEATLYLMNKVDWDLLVAVYKSPDDVGHLFWKYIDEEHPLYDAGQAKKFGDRIFRIYKKVDRAIATLLREIGENTVVMVMSDHGFGPVHYGVYLNNWLLDTGIMRLKTDGLTRIKYQMFAHGINLNKGRALARALRLTSFAYRGAYKKNSMVVKIVKKMFLSLSDVDWSKTKAYSFGNMGQIYVNLKGRENRGMVTPGEEYDNLVRYMIGKLKELKDPKTEKVIFDKIFAKDDIYSGPCLKEAPDIVFFESEMKYACKRLFEFGENKLIAEHPLYSGDHKPKGIFIATGDCIKEGTTIENANIVDMAPTILHTLGLPISSGMDGRVLKEIFKEDSDLSKAEIVYHKENEKLRVEARIRFLKALMRT